MRFTATMPRLLRIALLVLALAAMLGVATAAASPTHTHANSPGGGCDICFSAHFVSHRANFAIKVPAAPQAEQAGSLPGLVVAGYKLFFSHSSLTRGPPQRAV